MVLASVEVLSLNFCAACMSNQQQQQQQQQQQRGSEGGSGGDGETGERLICANGACAWQRSLLWLQTRTVEDCS